MESVLKIPGSKNPEDCRCASSDMLVKWLECIENGTYTFTISNGAKLSIKNIKAEMRSRVRCEEEGRTGYDGCADFFKDYL